MKVIKEIRKAAEDFDRQYMTRPKVVYMSSFTLDALKNETAAVWKVQYPGGVDKVFGMQIVVKEFLPIGVVVVGGVVHDATEDLLKELEELEERVAIMSEGKPDVIRCKDCKYWNGERERCWKIGQFTKEDWFCAEAERKGTK